MRAEVTPHTLTEIAENYDAALNWVETSGFSADRGRHADYRRTIAALLRHFPENGWGDFSDDDHRERVCTALLESRELVSIYKGLSGLDEPASLGNLKHYIKGPSRPTEEQASSSSNRARNFGFELYLNALFAYAGLRPEYGTDADLSFTIDGLRIFVEAKRPMTQPSALTSLRAALRQLVIRLQEYEQTDRAGIVALDLSKVINPENRVMLVRDEDHLHSLMYAEDKVQMAKLFATVTKNLKRGTVGVLLHYRLLTRFESTGSLNTVKWIGWVPFMEEPRLVKMHSQLEKVVRLVC